MDCKSNRDPYLDECPNLVKCYNKKEMDRLKTAKQALEIERNIKEFGYRKEEQEIRKQLDAFEKEKQKIRKKNKPRGGVPESTSVSIKDQYKPVKSFHHGKSIDKLPGINGQRSHSFHPHVTHRDSSHDAKIRRLKGEAEELKRHHERSLRQLHMSHGRLVEDNNPNTSNKNEVRNSQVQFPKMLSSSENISDSRSSDKPETKRRGLHKDTKGKVPASIRRLSMDEAMSNISERRHTKNAKTTVPSFDSASEGVITVHNRENEWDALLDPISKHRGTKHTVPIWFDPKHRQMDEEKEKLKEYHALLSKVDPKELAQLMLTHLQQDTMPKGYTHPHKRKLMALEILIRQLPAIRKELTKFKFDPVEMLSCRYLRLSENNINMLTKMCQDSGIDVGIHAHMTEDQVTEALSKKL